MHQRVTARRLPTTLRRAAWPGPGCAVRDAVRLLHQGDAEACGAGSSGRADQIGGLDAAAGPMTEYERAGR